MIKLPKFNTQNMFDAETQFNLFMNKERLSKFLIHYEVFKKIYKINGSIVECGVFKGTSLSRFAMMRELFFKQNTKKLIAFDVFSDKFALTPYYRFYFLQSEDFGGYGIFAEIFTRFSSGEYRAYNGLEGSSKITNYFDIAPGLAVGRKWINRKGFTFELLFGVGRNILYSDDEDYSGWYSDNRTAGKVRAGVTLGKRF